MEKQNKLILSNSLILYIRLFFVSVIGLVVTRIILKNLGIENFGIYAVVGGIVALVGFINTVMLASSNRYIAFEIGKGSESSINKIFNVCITIHGAIALLALLIGEIIGEWYIDNYLNIPPGKLIQAIWVFRFSLLGSVISFVGVPYIGLLQAKEKFFVFSIVDVLASVGKLIVSIYISYVSNKLVIYAALIGLITAFPTLIYYLYCRKNYLRLIRFHLYLKWEDYKEILNFSIWIGYGALASVSKSQGAALLINYFFGATLNSALGIAGSVNSIILNFASNARNAISPQITKSYAAGDTKRTEDLVIVASKYTFFLLLIPAVPIYLEIDYILKLWLVEIPQYTSIFLRLMIIDSLIGALNAGVTDAIFASGKIKWYQLIINTVFLLSLPIAYLLLKLGAEPYALLYAYIGVSFVTLILRQFLLYFVVKFNTKRLIFSSYFPAIMVTLALAPCFLLLKTNLHPFIIAAISILYLFVVTLMFGLNRKERKYFLEVVSSMKQKVLTILTLRKK